MNKTIPFCELNTCQRYRQVLLQVISLGNYAPHFHPSWEILYVLEGSLQIETQTEYFKLEQGEFALFSPNEAHALRSISCQSFLLCLQVSADFCNLSLPTACISSHCSATTSYLLKETCFYLAYHYYSDQSGSEFRCLSDLYRFFGILLSSIPCSTTKSKYAVELSVSDRRIQKILHYVHLHYQEKLTLKQLAEKEQLSLSYLSRQFKAKTGMNFQEYLTQIRYQTAVLLLKNTDLKIIDICLESGLSDSRYLCRYIQKHYHLSLQEFRQFSLPDFPEFNSASRPAKDLRIYQEQKSLELIRRYFSFPCDQNHEKSK